MTDQPKSMSDEQIILSTAGILPQFTPDGKGHWNIEQVREALRLARESQPAAPEAKPTEPCRTCKGTGVIKGAPDHYGLRRCLDCGGSGKVITHAPATPPAGEACDGKWAGELIKEAESFFSKLSLNNNIDRDWAVELMARFAHAHAAKTVEDYKRGLLEKVDAEGAELDRKLKLGMPSYKRQEVVEEINYLKQVRAWLAGE